MPQIKFIRTGANTQVGNFAPGDLLRCGEAMAHHLVEIARVAVLVEAPAVDTPPAAPVQAPSPAPAPAAARPRKRRNPKAEP